MPKCQFIQLLSTSGNSIVVLFNIASRIDKIDYQNKNGSRKFL